MDELLENIAAICGGSATGCPLEIMDILNEVLYGTHAGSDFNGSELCLREGYTEVEWTLREGFTEVEWTYLSLLQQGFTKEEASALIGVVIIGYPILR